MSQQRSAHLADTTQCVLSACESAVDILNDILVYDKLEGGHLELRKEEVSIIPFLTESLSIFRPMAAEKNIRLCDYISTTDTDAQRSWISQNIKPVSGDDRLALDAFKFRQVLRNVLSNALKFTPAQGEVALRAWLSHSASLARATPSLASTIIEDEELGTVRTAQCTLCIAITDSGVGMDPENQAKMFNESFQFNPEVLQGGGGSGLGMLLSKGIIDEHGGTLHVHSDGVGRGCTFTICLPGVYQTLAFGSERESQPGQHKSDNPIENTEGSDGILFRQLPATGEVTWSLVRSFFSANCEQKQLQVIRNRTNRQQLCGSW